MTNLLKHRDRISEIVKNNGPEETEYGELDSIIDSIENGNEAQEFRNMISTVLNNDTLFGHTYKKPYGYAGDFLLIEKIYQKYESKDEHYRKWDRFYHSHDATEAVRNRKKYCIQVLEELSSTKQSSHVLMLGSGPTTDVNEYFEKNKPDNIRFDLLDIDAKAIEYASNKNDKYLDQLNFIKANVIKFNTENHYDLIWSAGLFDYLDDRLFVYLLKRFSNNLREGGQIIIGNFSPSNPTIKVMEVMTEWFLNYRNEEHLQNLAQEADIAKQRISVEKEPLGINLFLKIK